MKLLQRASVGVIALIFMGGVIGFAKSALSQPNILLIISDDHGWQDYGFMGHPHIQTPNLDRLASRSIIFERGYSAAPLCRPSLASIATGLYPHEHGVTGNDPVLPDSGPNAMAERANPKYAGYYDAIVANFGRRPNFVRDLTRQGYLALQTGKWWEGDPVKEAGFTHAMTRGEAKDSRHGDTGLLIGRETMQPIHEFIERAGGRPWFVWYAPMLPHAPHLPPADMLAKYMKAAPSEPVARYWACVEWFDRTCGELFDRLQRINAETNTIIIYTADNGWIQDPDAANRFAARSKQSPYEGGIRTPILVSWPGRLSPRRDRTRLASNIDIYPTVAALAGSPLPPGLPGINLASAKATGKRSRVFGESYAHSILDVSRPVRSLQHRFMVEKWKKLILPVPGFEGIGPELYDLKTDPCEQQNLLPGAERDLRRMTREMDGFWHPE
jgi:uncharacterized sulfatase